MPPPQENKALITGLIKGDDGGGKNNPEKIRPAIFSGGGMVAFGGWAPLNSHDE